jgi:N-acetylmuramoyl-L-alanine amidase CwlA
MTRKEIKERGNEMKIEKFIQAHSTNYTRGRRNKIEYIVLHYVGALGGAEANLKYFQGQGRRASAHYFVDHAVRGAKVYQSVLDSDTAWHAGNYEFNQKSIGIEMCCLKDSKGNWYIDEETVKTTVELVQYLMKKYNIPIERVIRHYDITKKQCPEPWVRNPQLWVEFKEKVKGAASKEQEIARYRVIIGQKIGLQKETLDYLQAYTYGEALLEKIAKGLR